MRSSRWLVRLYGWLVRLIYPPSYRRRFGADQVATFADQQARRAPGASLRFGPRVLVDLFFSALAEWWRVLVQPDRVDNTEQRRGPGMAGATVRFQRDLVAAARLLVRRPAYSLPVIVTLAFGVAASVALFFTGRELATAPEADLRVANGDYFRALSVPVVSGRGRLRSHHS